MRLIFSILISSSIVLFPSNGWPGEDKSKALSYGAIVNGANCKIVFQNRDSILNKDSVIDFCGRTLKRDQVSGWTYFVNKGGWPQSFMTSITLGLNGKFDSFIVEFKNSEPHTSFLKSFAKWQSNLDPYN